jgi:hypothetical protein
MVPRRVPVGVRDQRMMGGLRPGLIPDRAVAAVQPDGVHDRHDQAGHGQRQ